MFRSLFCRWDFSTTDKVSSAVSSCVVIVDRDCGSFLHIYVGLFATVVAAVIFVVVAIICINVNVVIVSLIAAVIATGFIFVLG